MTNLFFVFIFVMFLRFSYKYLFIHWIIYHPMNYLIFFYISVGFQRIITCLQTLTVDLPLKVPVYNPSLELGENNWIIILNPSLYS